ncbi:MAG: RecX family transcriptional regulator [Alphaproteobacteria bacterium]|jgi:regulatory protein
MNDRKAASSKPRRPRKVTPQSLRNAALYYLQRYASSSANLRAVLTRRIRRAERDQEIDHDAAAGWIEKIVADFESSGLLDDKTYADARIQTMFRQGRSRRTMMLDLRKKGVAAEVVDSAVGSLSQETPAPDRVAAIRYARRRRLGPFRAADRAEHRERDLAAIARAGFDYETARYVIDADDPEGLEEDPLQA